MDLGEKLSRCLFRDGQIAAQMEFLVDIRLSSAVQPKPLIGTANHRFVSRELIPRTGRNRLAVGFTNSVVNSGVAPSYRIISE